MKTTFETKRHPKLRMIVQKTASLKRRHVEKVDVSTLCDESKLQPTFPYNWQQQFFENGVAVLELQKTGPSSGPKEREACMTQLDAMLARKHAVIVKICAEYVALNFHTRNPVASGLASNVKTCVVDAALDIFFRALGFDGFSAQI